MSKSNSNISIITKNAPYNLRNDFYHYFLKTSWVKILFYYFLFYLFVNLFFAYLFFINKESLSVINASFIQCFFFSIQTFSTVGYGAISPANLYGNIIVSIEIVFGLLSVAVTTGLVFAKFSKPTSKIIFTENLLISTINNQKVLTFRCANGRNNKIVSANIELHLLYSEKLHEGHSITRFKKLDLIKNYSPLFSLSWSIFHAIDQTSPLLGLTLEDMKEQKFEFLVVIKGTDETYYQEIHQTHFYLPENIIENKYFVDILQKQADGTRIIDYENFHKFEELK